MPQSEEIRHLERKIVQLEHHITMQDTEIFRQSRIVDKLNKRMEQIEGRLKGSAVGDEGDTGIDPADEKPPHY